MDAFGSTVVQVRLNPLPLLLLLTHWLSGWVGVGSFHLPPATTVTAIDRKQEQAQHLLLLLLLLCPSVSHDPINECSVLFPFGLWAMLCLVVVPSLLLHQHPAGGYCCCINLIRFSALPRVVVVALITRPPARPT